MLLPYYWLPLFDTDRPSLHCSWSGKNGEGASTKTCAIQRVIGILIFCSWQLFIRKLMKSAAVLTPRSLILMVMIKATMLMPWVQLHTCLCEFKATVFILPVVASWSSLNPSSWFLYWIPGLSLCLLEYLQNMLLSRCKFLQVVGS